MFRQLRLIAALALKDGKLFLADRRAAFLCFIVPIAMASGFGLIFDRPSRDLSLAKLPLLVVVEDDSPLTRQIVADLQQNDQLDVRLIPREAAERQVSRRASGVAVILPSGFGETASMHARRGEKPAVEMLHHPLSTMETHWVEGALTEIVMRRAAGEYLEPLGLTQSAIDRPFTVARRTVPAESNHPFNSLSHSFSGMTLQYLLFWGMECGFLLLRERKRGIWNRVRSAPVSLTAALLGRALSTALIALLQIAATFGFGYLVFGVSITGSILGFLLLAAAMSLLAAGVGLLVASIGRTEARGRSLFIVVILATAMLGGLWLPAFLLPKWVQDWSIALPTTWAMRGLDAVTWQGSNFAAMWPSFVGVTLFATTFLGLAILRFHWSENRLKRGEIA